MLEGLVETKELVIDSGVDTLPVSVTIGVDDTLGAETVVGIVVLPWEKKINKIDKIDISMCLVSAWYLLIVHQYLTVIEKLCHSDKILPETTIVPQFLT